MKKTILASAAITFSLYAFSQSDVTMDKKGTPSNDQWTEMSKTDGVVMKNGRVMLSQNGAATPIQSETTLNDGTKVTSNGTVIKTDGTQTMLKEGDGLDMSGKPMHIKMSKNTSGKSNMNTGEGKHMHTESDSTMYKK